MPCTETYREILERRLDAAYARRRAFDVDSEEWPRHNRTVNRIQGRLDSIPCELCNETQDNCACATCEHCAEHVENACATCERCQDCCDCHECSVRSCHTPVRPDDWCSDCERCTDHCECIHCDSCGANCGDDYCGECSCCTSCCECTRCACCGESVDAVCDDCSYCSECGHSRGCDNNGRPLQKHDLRFVESAEYKRNLYHRYASIELEIASADGHDRIRAQCSTARTSVVTDGSLPDTGFELNLQPANGDALVDVINDTCRALKADGAKVTKDCGYHVHIDARDLNFFDIARLIRLYARIEPALFKCVAKSRRTAPRDGSTWYCAKCGDDYLASLNANSSDVEEGIARGVYKESKASIERRKRSKYDSARYAALNLHSWLHRGTVECRLHHGTINASKVTNWALLWVAIVEAAKTRNVEALPVGSLPLDCNPLPNDPWECLLELAPNDDVRQWLIARRDALSDD